MVLLKLPVSIVLVFLVQNKAMERVTPEVGILCAHGFTSDVDVISVLIRNLFLRVGFSKKLVYNGNN